MRVEISETLEVRIFNDGEEVPFRYQPNYPDGAPFESVEAAQAWADEEIAQILASEVEEAETLVTSSVTVTL